MGSDGFVGWKRGSFAQCTLKEKMSFPTEKEVSREEKGSRGKEAMETHRYPCEQVRGRWDLIKRLKGVQRGREDVEIMQGQVRQKKALEDVGQINQD